MIYQKNIGRRGIPAGIPKETSSARADIRETFTSISIIKPSPVVNSFFRVEFSELTAGSALCSFQPLSSERLAQNAIG